MEVLEQIPPAELRAFRDLACTIGGYIVFPVQTRVDGRWRWSIDQSRACIQDPGPVRPDPGVHPPAYRGEASPLTAALAPYAGFFDLFGDFAGYVDHFLLADLVDHEKQTVRFFADFDDFSGVVLPAGRVDEYREFMSRAMAFVRARNERIAAFTTRCQPVTGR